MRERMPFSERREREEQSERVNREFIGFSSPAFSPRERSSFEREEERERVPAAFACPRERERGEKFLPAREVREREEMPQRDEILYESPREREELCERVRDAGGPEVRQRERFPREAGEPSFQSRPHLSLSSILREERATREKKSRPSSSREARCVERREREEAERCPRVPR